VGTEALGWILCGALLAGASSWLFIKRPWRGNGARPEEPGAAEARPLELPPREIRPQPEGE